MSERRKFSTNTPSEKRVGYSRAIESKDGLRLYISGTTSIDENGHVRGSTLYEQTNFVFNKIKGVINKAGYSYNDIVLLTVYLTDMDKAEEFDQAFIGHFSQINPACTLVGVSRLVGPDLLVEVGCLADRG